MASLEKRIGNIASLASLEIREAIRQEREACAKLIEGMVPRGKASQMERDDGLRCDILDEAAAAIRARLGEDDILAVDVRVMKFDQVRLVTPKENE
jgi:hypothetical protein